VGDIIIALLIGLAGGFAGGMLGVGGGAIYVPGMVILLDEQQHIAQGASLAAIVATALVGGLTHLRQGNVDVPAVARVVPSAVVAGFIGGLVADRLDASVLQRIFSVVMAYLAFTMIRGALRGEPVLEQEVGG
jgi:uncharacterized membrane protein YfcA